MRNASDDVRKFARKMMDDQMPAGQRRLVPQIAWRRFVDFMRTWK
jgi:hypothetical protein